MGFKSFLTKVKEKFGGFQLLIMIIIFVLLFYYSSSSKWILTTQQINVTDPYNKTIEVEGIYSYVYKGYIPKQNSFEFTNKQIPKNSFEFEKAFLLMFLITILILLYTYKQTTNKESITKEEAEEKVKKYLERLEGNGEISEYHVPESGFLKDHRVDDKEPTAYRWYIPAEVKTSEGLPEYRVIGLNPYNGKILEDLKTIKEFSGEDKCPKCGKFHSFRTLTPEWYDLYSEKFTNK